MKKSELERAIIHAIIAALTPNQLAALKWLPADGTEKALDKTPRLLTSLYHLKSKTVISCVEAALVGNRSARMSLTAPDMWSLKPLGVKVMAAIAASEPPPK